MSEDVLNNETEATTELNTDWRESLDEGLRGEASLSDFKDINGLAKSYVNAQRMLGSSIRIPGEDASDEARNEFYEKLANVPGVVRSPDPEDPESLKQLYAKLGRPEDATGYKVELPEGVQLNEQALGEFNKIAHEAGLTNKQYETMVSVYAKEQESLVQRQSELQESFLSQAKEMWGPEFSQRVEAAKAVKDMYMEKYPDAMQALVSGPNGNNPALLAMLAELSGTFQEKGMVGSATKFQFGTSSEEALDKINEIMANRDHPYWSGDQAAVSRVNKLYAIAYGE